MIPDISYFLERPTLYLFESLGAIYNTRRVSTSKSKSKTLIPFGVHRASGSLPMLNTVEPRLAVTGKHIAPPIFKRFYDDILAQGFQC
jgi:hypothetical protein